MPWPFDYPSMGSQVAPQAQLGNIGGGDPLLMQLLAGLFQSRGMQFPGQGQMQGAPQMQQPQQRNYPTMPTLPEQAQATLSNFPQPGMQPQPMPPQQQFPQMPQLPQQAQTLMPNFPMFGKRRPF